MSEKEAIQRQIDQLRAGKQIEQLPAAAGDDQDVERQDATVGASMSKEQLQQQIDELRAGKAAAVDAVDTERLPLTSVVPEAVPKTAPDTDLEDQPPMVLVWTAKMASIDEVTVNFLLRRTVVKPAGI
jgi:hypothetical protein